MKKTLQAFILFVFFQLPISIAAVANVENTLKENVTEWMANQAVAFTENKGQLTDMEGKLVPQVLFKASAGGLDLYITKSGLSYVFLDAEEEEEYEGKGIREKLQMRWCRVDMDLKGASIKAENIETENAETKYFNYYQPHCPDGILNVKTYGKVTIKNVYPGIDWVLYTPPGKQAGFKYDFVVHPGADPANIKLLYKGTERIDLLKNNCISMVTPMGKITEGALYCYQEQKKINASFSVKNNEVSYSVTDYDKSLPLVIDPPLIWSTFHGGSALDGVRGVTVDNAGNFLVAGYSQSANFPTVNPGGGAFFQGVSGLASNATIFKITNSGVILWATYYSGSNGEWAWDIASDNSANILVTGRTQSNNFPTLNPGGGAFFQSTVSGGYDAFILKFNSAGVRFWATVYGGNSADEAFGITADAAGNFAVVGCSQSSNLTLFNPGGGAYYQATNAGIYDLFILKFNTACVMTWGTNYGGNSQDFFPVVDGGTSMDITADISGNIFITGQTLSTNFPTMNPGGGAYYQAAPAGGFDAFFLKFSPASILLWGTCYGAGSGDDIGYDIKTDKNGNVFATGATSSGSFPTLNPGGGAFFQAGFGGGFTDAFIVKFTNGGVRLWSTYYGGSGRDIGFGSNVDACGNYYVTGCTTSSNLSTLNPGGGSFFSGTYGGAGGYSIGDMFIFKFNAACVRLWATYLGGTGDQWGEDIALDALSNIFVGGEYHTASVGHPLLNPGGGAYYQATGSGGDESAFIKFGAPVVLSNTFNSTSVTCNGGSNGTATASISGGTSPYTYSWNPTGQSTQTSTGLSAGTYTITVTDANCNVLTSAITITQPAGIVANASAVNASCGNSNGSATTTVSGGTGTLTYSWSPSGGTGANATGLSSGVYTVTVTDGGGCSKTTTTAVGSSGGPTASISSQTNVLCNGNSSGVATASAGSGTSPYTYSWTNGGTNASTTGLSAGTYTVTITDANNCSQTQTVVITQPGVLSANASSVAANCNSNNGSTSVTASGGTGTLTYSWSSGSTLTSATGLSAGTYTCTVTDVNSCTKTVTVSVSSTGGGTAGIQSSTNINCNGGNNGTATASSTGGTSPYTYSWNNGLSTSAATGLSAGTYTCTVTDSLGCSATVSVSISQPAAMAVNPNSANTDCGATNGTATANATGGTGAYTYSWSNGATIQQATNLSAGTYTITVTDANGCTKTAATTVGTNGGPTANAGVNVTIVQGTSTVLNATGGGTYSWSPPLGLSCTNCQNPTASPTVTTVYIVTVTDVNGCTATAAVTVVVDIPCPSNNDYTVPNAFSPNGDGHNDMFVLQGWKDCIAQFSMIIYDRWGEKVYESADPAKGWDGMLRGKMMDAGVFVYYIDASLSNGDSFSKKGNITLVK